MKKRHLIAGFLIALVPGMVTADDRLVRLNAPQNLVQSGILSHILPRFTLKTQVRVQPITEGTADLTFGTVGTPIFEGAGQVWHMSVAAPDHKGTARFVDWLTSEVGRNAITSYAPEGTPLFSLPSEKALETVALDFDGDPVVGLKVSETKCGRCHVFSEASRMKSIGSTPSFFVLRSLPDWAERFSIFYVLNPHPSFTQVEDVTEPFPDDRPSPIVPVTMTLDEVEAVLAYVANLPAADLGAPLQHQ